ncbi:MAG TPA: DUF3857 domain-containing protein, partial [Flavisolibacter sp.]|nr:DUF3857 domain-containing protein [Flavisolibacter sp.]
MRTLATLLLCLLAYGAFSQETSRFAKFGKITADDLRKKVYSIDSGANAVVLSDIGAAAIEGNSKNWFSIVFTRHRVVHILNKNGYNKADVEIILYFDGNAEERLESIKAVTYNLEGDKVIETKLEKENIFKEKIDKNRLVKKFTMPAVKEGSIIEFEYKVTSDFITNLDAWAFQGSAPVLWSEYTLSVPEFFSYAFLAHGYHPVHIADKKNTMNSFTVIDANSTGASDRTRFTAGVTDYRWVMKDVPEIKPESFSSALKNHISALEFQLSSMNPPLRSQSFRNSWPGLISSLIESEYFGKNLNSVNTWMSDEIKPLTAKASSDLEKAKNIYEYV